MSDIGLPQQKTEVRCQLSSPCLLFSVFCLSPEPRQQPHCVIALDGSEIGGAEAVLDQPLYVILTRTVRVIGPKKDLRRRHELRQRCQRHWMRRPRRVVEESLQL